MIALLLLVGCSGLDYDASKESFSPDTGNSDTSGTLRVDVIPAADSLGLSPQSFRVEPGQYEDNTFAVAPTVTVTGTISATVYQGWVGVGPPTIDVPLEATITASRIGYLQGGGAVSLSSGAGAASYSLTLPGDAAYAVSIVPSDPTAAPFGYQPEVSITSDQTWVDVLDPGAPVYGHVVDADGNAVGGAQLQLRRADLELSTPVFSADDDGWFLVRAAPGYDYVLETVSEVATGSQARPAVALPFTLDSDDGAELELDVGELVRADVAGRAVAADGSPLGAATIRVRSTSLDATTGSFENEITAQSDGKFDVDLLPGDYSIEISADYETPATPVTLSLHLGAGSTDLGDVTLAAPTKITGSVASWAGHAAGGASVSLRETSYGGFTWNTTTDDEGNWSVEGVPSLPLEVTITPADIGQGAITRVYQQAGQANHVELVQGHEVSGVVQVADSPVPYALIEVRDWSTEEVIARTLTDDTGAFSVRVDPALLRPAKGGEDTGGEVGDTGDTADTGG